MHIRRPLHRRTAQSSERSTVARVGRLWLGVAISASAVLSAGCGASGPQGPRLSHEEFVKRMHAICRPVNLMRGSFGDPAYDERLLAGARHELDELRNLNPPMADEKRLSDAFDHWSSALDDFERLAHAAETKDRASGQKAFRDAAAEARAISRLIPDYPAGECLGEGIG
jgi:hypothetical protein